MANYKPNENNKIKITVNNKEYFIDPDKLPALNSLIVSRSASPFWSRDEIEYGDRYYYIDEEPGDDTGDGFAFTSHKFDELNMAKLAYTKDERFAKIQFWREILFRKLLDFKMRNADVEKGDSNDDVYWIVSIHNAHNNNTYFMCPEAVPYPPRREDTVRLGTLSFPTKRLAQEAIDDIICPLLDETGLDEDACREILVIE